MKTLVIHPKDQSTEFLCEIYKDKDWTILNNIPNKFVVNKAIEKHDRILMMGHGSPSGLFNIQHDRIRGFIIDESTSVFLKDKQCAFIWCNADQYVKKNCLGGFYTGMFISEVAEANYCNVVATQSEVTESNYGFAKLVSDWLFNDNSVDSLKESYSFNTEVCRYNANRLYKSTQESNTINHNLVISNRQKLVDLIAFEVKKKKGFVPQYEDAWGLIMNAYQVAKNNNISPDTLMVFGEAILSGNLETALINGGKVAGLILEEVEQ